MSVKTLREYGTAFVLSVILVTLSWLTTSQIKAQSGLDVDGKIYAEMAARGLTPDGTTIYAPWCWRVLTPALSSLLPFDVVGDFKTLAFVSHIVSLFLLYCLLRGLGREHLTSLVGLLLYAGVFWTVKFAFFSPAYVDFQTQTLLLLTLFLMVLRRYGLIPFVLTLGVLQKESLLFLAPIVFIHIGRTEGWFKPKSLILLLLFLIPPLMARGWITSRVIPDNIYSPLGAYADNAMEQLTSLRFYSRFGIEIFSGTGLILLLLLFRAKAAGEFLREHPEWTAQLILGTVLLFGGVDKARLFLLMLPALVVIASAALEPLLVRPSRAVSVWFAVTLLLHCYWGHHFTPMGTDAQYRARMVPLYSDMPLLPTALHLLAVLTLWVCGTLLLMSRRRDSPVPPAASEGKLRDSTL